jgi:hypothetical protein
MNLKEALLCVDCEWLFEQATNCPRCGSQVTYPLARAMDRRLAAVGCMARPVPPPRLVPRPATLPPPATPAAVLDVPEAEPQVARLRWRSA